MKYFKHELFINLLFLLYSNFPIIFSFFIFYILIYIIIEKITWINNILLINKISFYVIKIYIFDVYYILDFYERILIVHNNIKTINI